MLAVAFVLAAPSAHGTVPPGVAAAGETAAAPPHTDPPITILDGRSLTECISAAPRPGCTTSKSTDIHQMAVFGVLTLGVALIVWRITVAIRRRDRIVNR